MPEPAPGIRWPAEWEPHEATLIAWPHDPTTWPSGVEHAEAVFAQLVAAISRGEVVHLLVADDAMARRARAHLAAFDAREERIRLHHIPTADAWVRDYGPIIVTTDDARGRGRLALDFVFNAWGRKYAELAVDDGVPARLDGVLGIPRCRIERVLEGGSIDGNGAGIVLTSEQCLLNANRNPSLDRAAVEALLRDSLGASHVLWLGRGIAGDDTDGHVDDITRFVGPRTALTAVQPDPQHPDHAPLAENRVRLRGMQDAGGRPLEILELPMPGAVLDSTGDPLPASHANFYVCNAAVCVPVFGGASDETALRLLARCFPDRDVVPIRCERLVEGLGGLHCVTQQVPRAHRV